MYANDNVQVTISSLLERGNMFLQDGEWKKAQDYFNRVLDAEPHNADAYLGLCLSNHKLKSLDQFIQLNYNYTDDINYSKAYQFADQTTKARLDAVYSEWEMRWNAINSAKQARNAQAIIVLKRAIIVLAITVLSFSVLYFIVLPMVTNALLSADIISLSEADDIFSITPYSYSYTIKGGGAFTVPEYCQRLSCINIDTDEAISIYLTSFEHSDYCRIVNRSDSPHIVFYYVDSGRNVDKYELQGFDDYVSFGEADDEYGFSLHYYTKDTTELILNSALSELEKDNFSSLKKLEKLELYNAEIMDISFLKDNKKLEKITITNCSYIPGNINDFMLDCSILSEMPLSELRLNGFYFSSINLDRSVTDSLSILDLSNNKLDSISVAGMPKLETLNLSDNDLSIIKISDLPELKSCDISNNSIKRFEVTEMPKLEILNLSDNDLSVIKISDLPELKSCDVSYNSIKLLEISDCGELAYMNIAHSKYLTDDLTNINNVVLPETLNKLRIAINDDANLSELADKYSNIQSLILEYRSQKCLGIEGIQEFDNLKELCVINEYVRLDNTEYVKEGWIRWLSYITKHWDNVEKVSFGASTSDLIVLKG